MKNIEYFLKKISSVKGLLFGADIILLVDYTILSHNLVSFPIIILAGMLCLTTYMISYWGSESRVMKTRIFNLLRRDSFGIYLYSDSLNYIILMIGAILFGGKIWNNDIYSTVFFLARLFGT